MEHSSGINSELIEEISFLRRRIKELEQSEPERKRTEEALQKSEAKFKHIFETIEDLYYETDYEGIVKVLSPSVRRLTGWSEEDLIGKPATTVYVDPDDRGRLIEKLSEKGHVHDYELLLKKKDGEERQASLSARLIVGEDGRPTGVSGLLRDITERKRVDEALRSQFQFLQHLIDTIPSPVFYKDREGLYQGCNEAFEEYVGLTKESIIQKTVFEVHPKEVGETYALRDRDLFGSPGTEAYETVIQHTSGAKRDILISKATYNDAEGHVAGLVGVMTDITERKHAEVQLRRSEAQLRQIIDLVPHMIFVKDWNGKYLLVNRAVAEGYGTTVDSLEGKSHADFHPSGDELQRMLEDDREVMTKGEVKFIPEEPYTDASGTQRFLQTIKVPFHTPDDQRAVLGVAIDITERIKAEEEIRASEERYRTIVENTNDAIYIHDFEGNIIDVNENACVMAGYNRDELVGANLSEIDNPENTKYLPVRMEQLTKDGSILFEGSHVRKDGSLVPVEVSAKVITRNGKGIIQGFVRDITDRKLAEGALKESESLQRILLANLPAGVIIIDPVTKMIENVNNAAAAMFGVQAEDIVGHRCHAFLCPAAEDACPVCDLGQEVDNSEREMICADSSRRPVLKSVKRIQMQSQEKLLECFIDITDRKRSEEEKEASNHSFARPRRWKPWVPWQAASPMTSTIYSPRS